MTLNPTFKHSLDNENLFIKDQGLLKLESKIQERLNLSLDIKELIGKTNYPVFLFLSVAHYYFKTSVRDLQMYFELDTVDFVVYGLKTHRSWAMASDEVKEDLKQVLKAIEKG